MSVAFSPSDGNAKKCAEAINTTFIQRYKPLFGEFYGNYLQTSAQVMDDKEVQAVITCGSVHLAWRIYLTSAGEAGCTILQSNVEVRGASFRFASFDELLESLARCVVPLIIPRGCA